MAMNPEIKKQMLSFSAKDGDRIDPVAYLCRRMYLRVMCCPCFHATCTGCISDIQAIENAWNAPLPKPNSA